MGEPVVEWAVEVTWRDWRKAGAEGPTSQFGPFDTARARNAFEAAQRRDREVIATRVLARQAIYTSWEPTEDVRPTTPEEREALLDAEWRRVNPGASPSAS